MAKRKASPGAWKKGQSGNPGGRPKAVRDVAAAARLHTRAAIDCLANLLTCNHPAARARAAEILLDRAWGRAPATVTLEGGKKPVGVAVPAPAISPAAARSTLVGLGLLGAFDHLRKLPDDGTAHDAPTPHVPGGGNGNGHGGNGAH